VSPGRQHKNLIFLCPCEKQFGVRPGRFGTGSDFGFRKPFRFFGLPVSRPAFHTIGFGMGSVGIGSTEKTLEILRLAGSMRVPHNPLVEGSSPSRPTISIKFL